ncbi:ribonuclease H-like domain-containing protein [Stachybotrys elegans]|uniref:ribonuclease H n=1 Tax=Stachybotrys elegans TaxID=80388 RepID=A0A8K0SLT1_9HYPO|nr:ribonuclease H-like domain-containing protein [Stachybotrys elegans]
MIRPCSTLPNPATMPLETHVCSRRHGEPNHDFAVRRFEPKSLFGSGVDLDSIEVPSDDGRFTYVACGNEKRCVYCGGRPAHVHSIIVAVDGACKGNGKPGARASVGVFVGPSSKYNKFEALSAEFQTNQVAELRAGIVALELVRAMKIDLDVPGLNEVVIKSDSDYLVKGMTDWVFKWTANSYRTSKGVAVTNAALFKTLNQSVKDLNNDNIKVSFWHVPRSQNKEADQLANRAFGADMAPPGI